MRHDVNEPESAARQSVECRRFGIAGRDWIGGATLLVMVVIKLLLVDLARTGTVAQIVSFIGVGLLLLVIGYVAPLPARRSGDPA